MDLIDSRYRILEKLGKGGMGVVYKVRDENKKRILALKMIGEKSPEQCEFLKKEFEVLTHLRHPNLCLVYDFGFYKNRPYFTMEYLRGEDILNSFSTGRYGSFISIVIQIFRALSYLHSKGIIHGDLKPQNIIYIKNRIKLIDFGLAESLFTEKKKIAGTLPYLAPEVILRREQDSRSDLYSMGVILYEIISGGLPFKSRRLEGIIQERKSVVKPLRDISPELSNIILRLMSFNPEKRFKSAREVIKAIGKRYSVETKITRRSYLYSTKMIGREKEIRRIKGIFKGINEEKGKNLVFVTGEEGIGKSRLLEEIRIWGETNGFKVLVGDCHRDKASYEPYRRIISEMGRKRIFRLPLPPKFNLMNKISDTIGGFAKEYGSLLIILEDIDLADEATIELTSFLSRKLESEPILFLVSCSNIPLVFTSTARIGKGYQEVNLRPLSRFQISELITLMVDIDKPVLFDFVYKNCAGNPLFIKEILSCLINKNVINLERGEVDEKKLNNVSFPSSLKEITKWVLDDLEQDAIELLKIGALKGEKFTPKLLTTVSGKKGKLVEREIGVLLKKGLILQEGTMYKFSRIIYRDQIKEKIGKNEGKILHQKIARYLEKRKKKDIQQIAFHYIYAGVKKKAIYYGFKAAEEAINVHSPLTGIMLYRNLEKIAGINRRSSIELYKNFAYLLHLIGRYDEAFKRYKQAEDLAVSKVEKGLLKIKQASVLQSIGRYKESEIILRESEGFFRPFSANWIEARSTSVRPYNLIGNYKKSFTILSEIMQNKKEVKPEVNNLIGATLYHLGRLKEAERFHLKAIKFARSVGTKLDALNNLGILYYQKGIFEKAIRCFKKCLKIAVKQGDLKRIISYYNNVGVIFRTIGKREEALIYLEKAYKIAYETDDPEVAIAALINIGNLHIEIGDFEQASDNLSRAFVNMRKIDYYQLLPEYFTSMGKLLYCRGFYKKALIHYQKAVRIAKNQSSEIKILDTLYLLAKLFAEIGLQDKVEKETINLSALAMKVNSPVYQVYSFCLSSEIEKKKANLESAIKFAENGCILARKIGGEELMTSLCHLIKAYLANRDLGRVMDLLNEMEEKITNCSNREILSDYYFLKAGFEFKKGEMVANKRCLEYLVKTEENACNRPDFLWRIYFLRGRTYERMERIDDAAGSFQKSIEVLDNVASRLDEKTKDSYLTGERAECLNYIEEFLGK